MHPKEYAFIEAALLKQRVTIRRVGTAGHLAFRRDGQTIGFLHGDSTVGELQAYLYRLGRTGRIRWPPEW